MAIDIRATVTCSLGTLISGSISDDYIQDSGLVKTKGSVELSALVTPAIGTAVTFSYVKGGVTRSIPRKLRVMSSFADPFRRTTKVELGCKLTYLSDLQEPVDWTAFDDPENAAYDEEDGRIVTLPIYASSAMDKCLTELGITASSNPLTNKFSVAAFDFGGGYVQVLNDLLVSESYCGYLDTNEVLQVFNLDQDAGTGPVFTASDIVDLGPIGVGALPGEAVTVSYSSLKLKNPDADQNTDELNWEYQETIGAVEQITVQYENPNLPDTQLYKTWYYTPRTVTETTYDEWDRVSKRVSTEYLIGAAINTQFYVDSWTASAVQLITYIGFYEVSEQQIVNTETIEYRVPAAGPKPEEGYEDVLSNTRVKVEPEMAIAGSIAASFLEDDGTLVAYMPLLGSTTTEITVTTFETQSAIIKGSETPITKTTTSKRLAYGYTQFGQQETARRLEKGTSTTTTIFNAMVLTFAGTEVTINAGRGVGLQERPSSAERTNAAYSKGGDPNNGWRTESTADLELALGSATAQRRIELSMPYAPDDIFSGPTGGPFTATASDAPEKANRYGRVQNRLLLGNRSGINLQLAPEKLPAAPYSPLYVQASGLTALYRANGTSWVFDSNGIVASVDALFWAAVGGTGTFWFPVAPGITTLPTTPAIVDGTMTPTTVVLPYNETAIYNGILRTRLNITKFDYSLSLLTVIDPLTITLAVSVARVIPSTNISLAAHTPTLLIDVGVQVPVGSVAIRAYRPYTQNLSLGIPVSTIQLFSRSPYVNNLRIAVPAAQISLAPQAPTLLTTVKVDSITYTQSNIYPGTTPASNAIMTDGSFTNTGAGTDTTESVPGSWIKMDLGGSTSVGSIVVGTATSNIPGGWDKSYTENKDIQYSVDNSSWTTVTNTGTFASNGIYTFTVDITARYIRIANIGLAGLEVYVGTSEFYALAPGQSYP